jgi:hypothetical protein
MFKINDYLLVLTLSFSEEISIVSDSTLVSTKLVSINISSVVSGFCGSHEANKKDSKKITKIGFICLSFKFIYNNINIIFFYL